MSTAWSCLQSRLHYLCFSLCFFLQPGPRGLGEDQRFLDDGSRVLFTQQLHLHRLTHRVQLQGQVSESQALLAAVAVCSRRCVADHLRKKPMSQKKNTRQFKPNL